MMNQKERFLALLHNEPVDGFVNQYGAMGGWAGFLRETPLAAIDAHPKGQTTVSKWGITYDWPEGEPGAVPNTDPDHVPIPDMEEWESYMKAHKPDLSTKDSDWDDIRAKSRAIDTKTTLTTAFFAPGTFEYMHSFMTFEDSLMNILIYPDEYADMVKFITDWRMDYMDEVLKHLPEVEVVFAHDDWGSKFSTFMSPEDFREVFAPNYKRLYGVAKDHGCIVVHHSDSYCTTLLDDFFDIGIDVWQGVLPSNDYEGIQKRLNDEKREFILWGGLDSAVFDRDDSTPEEIKQHVADTMKRIQPGGHWIPSVNDGLPVIIHQQNYDIITDAINELEPEWFPRG